MQPIQLTWPKPKAAIRAAILALVGLTAVHNAVFVPFMAYRGIACAKVAALAAMEEPPSLIERSPIGFLQDADISMAYMSSLLATPPQEMLHKGVELRRVAHTSEFNLIVLKPIETADKIRVLAERMGGYLVTSQTGSDNNYADVSISVPVVALEQTEMEIRKLALRIESESSAAEDVTKDWVDNEARLHTLRATEQQYFQILQHAASVKDTLEVTGKLNEVRGQIEQLQAEFAALSKRVQSVALSVRLRADADIQVLGLRWRPLYRAKLSLSEAVDSLGSYGATMFSVILHIPVIALWLVTIVAFAALGWKALRWAARLFFGWKTETSA